MKTIQETIVIPQEPVNMRNKSTSAKPLSESIGVSCKPVSLSKFIQTDDFEPTGSKKPFNNTYFAILFPANGLCYLLFKVSCANRRSNDCSIPHRNVSSSVSSAHPNANTGTSSNFHSNNKELDISNCSANTCRK